MRSAVSSSKQIIFLRLLVILTALLTQPAWAQGLVLIVNPSSGVEHLNRHQALDIFLGRFRTFPSGISALPLDLDVSCPERRQFYLMLANKDTADMASYWARLTFTGKVSPPFTVSDARMAVDFVANNRNAIAYVDRAAVDNRVRIVLELTE